MPKKSAVAATAPVPAGYAPAADIPLDDINDLFLAVDEHGTTYCYLGYWPSEDRDREQFYRISVAARDKASRSKWLFPRLHHGAIFLDGFLSTHGHYKVVKDRRIIMPTGADSYYGVKMSGSYEEDEVMTRELFGATYDELKVFLPAFSSATDEVPYQNSKCPRITFSRTRNNDCDLTRALIPREFPFIALEETTEFKGHVSFGGMFRLLAFLCNGYGAGATQGNKTYQSLISCGANKEVLDRLIKAGFDGYLLPLFPSR